MVNINIILNYLIFNTMLTEIGKLSSYFASKMITNACYTLFKYFFFLQQIDTLFNRKWET